MLARGGGGILLAVPCHDLVLGCTLGHLLHPLLCLGGSAGPGGAQGQGLLQHSRELCSSSGARSCCGSFGGNRRG